MANIRKRHVAIILSQLEQHPNPDPKLEQYTLTGETAAELLHFASQLDGIKNRNICDLGCGTGIITAGALILGANLVIGVDIDKKALQIARKNLGTIVNTWNLGSLDRVLLTRADINHLNITDQAVDLVLQNPPFGVQRRGADMLFLKKAIQIAPVVYSIHKAGNKGFIQKMVRDARITHTLQLTLPLPPTQPFHTKRFHRVLVEIHRLARYGENGEDV